MLTQPNGSIRMQMFINNEKMLDKWILDVDGEKDKPAVLGSGGLF